MEQAFVNVSTIFLSAVYALVLFKCTIGFRNVRRRISSRQRRDSKDKVNPNEAKYEVLDNNEPTEKKGEETPMKVGRSEVGWMKSADTIDEVKRTEDEVTEETTKKHDDTIDRRTATDDSLEDMTATGDRQGTDKAVALKARGLEKSIKLKQKSNNQTKRAQDRVLDSAEDDSSGSSSSEMEQRLTHEGECLNEENEEENRKKEGNLEEDSKIESRSLQSETNSQISKCSRMEMNSNDSDEAHPCIGSITDGDSIGERISAGLNNITKNQKVQEKAGTNQINGPKKADNKAGELDFANALKELKALREKEKPNSGEQSAVLQHMGFVSNKESEEKKGKERKPAMAAINKVNLPMLRNTDEKNKKVKEKVQKKVVNPPHECPKSETIINQEKSGRSRPLMPARLVPSEYIGDKKAGQLANAAGSAKAKTKGSGKHLSSVPRRDKRALLSPRKGSNKHPQKTMPKIGSTETKKKSSKDNKVQWLGHNRKGATTAKLKNEPKAAGGDKKTKGIDAPEKESKK